MGEHFFIPSYQRGYRWTGTQVTELLDDILEFARNKNRSPDAFYCLQPIVVKACTWDVDEKKVQGWELVDGQQRLTTIWILLNYLEKKVGRKDLFSIEYQTRKNTSSYLKDLFNDALEDENDISIVPIEIDLWHIQEAFKNIDAWFDKHPSLKEDRPEKSLTLNNLYNNILEPLVYDRLNEESKRYGTVQIIWYETEEINPITTFRRLNAGKIPLTNSELIKALFLQKRNFVSKDSSKISDDVKSGIADGIYLRQLQIATKWDEIENALHDESFWLFLTNQKEDASSSRIGFIFDLIKTLQLKDKTENEIKKFGDDGYTIFRYFYQTYFENETDTKAINNTWKIVTDYFNTFEEWFNDPVYYHYIGFLVYCNENIVDIYNDCKSDIKTREDVKNKLVQLISGHFKKIKIENLKYGDDKIRELLLLYNIQIIISQNEKNKTENKFPFSTFKNVKKAGRADGTCSWDIEHIDSYSENPLDDPKDQKAWLEDCKSIIKQVQQELTSLNQELVNTDEINILLQMIENYASKPDSFEYLYDRIQNFFGEHASDENDEKKKNSIGNLTLLDSGTNRSYKNAIFPLKRERIIEEDKAGTFIPPGTRNIFLKYFDNTGTSHTRWSSTDIDNYRKDFETKLAPFFEKG
jgi:uncharacterized protein with ParB-like and HNH nuclease domain